MILMKDASERTLWSEAAAGLPEAGFARGVWTVGRERVNS
jgi:hypothetical protein